jgi:hypothetical protein
LGNYQGFNKVYKDFDAVSCAIKAVPLATVHICLDFSKKGRLLVPASVSLGLLCDSRTQDWGATEFISKEIRGQGKGGRIERILIYVSFKTSVWAQPLVGRNAELGRATVSST